MRFRAARVQVEAPLAPPLHFGEAANDCNPLYYFDREIDSQAAKILPGEYLVTSRGLALVTLLGSCVAACLRDPLAGVGGLNHFMLPDGGAGLAGESARYGGYAMEMLLNELMKRGASRSRIEAKVFGGGAVLKNMSASIGEKNAVFVREYLERERIPIVAEDLLDIHPRKIFYFPQTGRALVKRLPHAHDDEVDRLERLYQTRLLQQPVIPGEIELFS